MLNKNLNFVPTQTSFSKTRLNKELEDFYRLIKLKAHFKNAENKDRFSEEDIFRKAIKKSWIPNNNYHSIGTFIEATRNEINNEIKKKETT